jgi:hypothetical protein
MKPLLAILIPTITERQHLLDRLVAELDRQRSGKNVIIIISSDNREKTTGQKRNDLVEAAVANNVDYIAFFDDDDMPGETYIQRGIEVAESGMDVGELWGQIYWGRIPGKPFHHSLIHKKWYEDSKYYYRMPNHLNFQKLSAVKDIPFPDQSFGEDGKQSYAMRDAGVLKTEFPIKDILYHYYVTTKKK